MFTEININKEKKYQKEPANIVINYRGQEILLKEFGREDQRNKDITLIKDLVFF